MSESNSPSAVMKHLSPAKAPEVNPWLARKLQKPNTPSMSSSSPSVSKTSSAVTDSTITNNKTANTPSASPNTANIQKIKATAKEKWIPYDDATITVENNNNNNRSNKKSGNNNSNNNNSNNRKKRTPKKKNNEHNNTTNNNKKQVKKQNGVNNEGQEILLDQVNSLNLEDKENNTATAADIAIEENTQVTGNNDKKDSILAVDEITTAVDATVAAGDDSKTPDATTTTQDDDETTNTSSRDQPDNTLAELASEEAQDTETQSTPSFEGAQAQQRSSRKNSRPNNAHKNSSSSTSSRYRRGSSAHMGYPLQPVQPPFIPTPNYFYQPIYHPYYAQMAAPLAYPGGPPTFNSSSGGGGGIGRFDRINSSSSSINESIPSTSPSPSHASGKNGGTNDHFYPYSPQQQQQQQMPPPPLLPSHPGQQPLQPGTPVQQQPQYYYPMPPHYAMMAPPPPPPSGASPHSQHIHSNSSMPQLFDSHAVGMGTTPPFYNSRRSSNRSRDNLSRSSSAFGIDIIANIAAQLDYYFSKENLIKDTYLRSHMKDGYVSLNFISQFARFKALTGGDLNLAINSLGRCINVEYRLEENGEYLLKSKFEHLFSKRNSEA